MDPISITAAACGGLAVGSAAVFAAVPPADAAVAPLERERRGRLGTASRAYRDWGPAVRGVADLLQSASHKLVAGADAALAALAQDDWRGGERLAVHTLKALPGVALAAAAVGYWTSATTGVGVGLGLLLAVPVLSARDLNKKAAHRVAVIRTRLPYTLDLMALVLEAGGGTLLDCLRLGAKENPDHPLGDELRRVVFAVDAGARPTDALNILSRRLGDADVAEVGLAVATSETRGLPLKDTLRAVAGRLRNRQIQWQEKASERAKVHITWPAMLVMLACLLVVVAPAVLAP